MSRFEQLYNFDVSKWVETKGDLAYLSWAPAWVKFKQFHPEATYEIKKFDNGSGRLVPYMYDERIGYMVMTSVTANEDISEQASVKITYEMWLPVMDEKNKAMKIDQYEYSTKYGKKTVESISMFEVNKAIMRCLVKNLAMFGLGIKVYTGEDLPQEEFKKNEENEKEIKKHIYKCKKCGKIITRGAYENFGEKCSNCYKKEKRGEKENG